MGKVAYVILDQGGRRMKISDLIKKLTETKEKYGDLPIISYFSDMEQRGYMAGHIYADVKFATEEQVRTYDAFDYTPYTYTRYNLSKEEKKAYYSQDKNQPSVNHYLS